jgi:hypothetical protein
MATPTVQTEVDAKRELCKLMRTVLPSDAVSIAVLWMSFQESLAVAPVDTTLAMAAVCNIWHRTDGHHFPRRCIKLYKLDASHQEFNETEEELQQCIVSQLACGDSIAGMAYLVLQADCTAYADVLEVARYTVGKLGDTLMFTLVTL